jgi:hypothetical protein
MVSPINRVAQQAAKPQEVKAAASKTEVKKTEAKKDESVVQKPAAPVRDNNDTKTDEVKEPAQVKAEEALRTLASQEQNPMPATSNKNTVSPEAVIAAYK